MNSSFTNSLVNDAFTVTGLKRQWQDAFNSVVAQATYQWQNGFNGRMSNAAYKSQNALNGVISAVTEMKSEVLLSAAALVPGEVLDTTLLGYGGTGLALGCLIGYSCARVTRPWQAAEQPQPENHRAKRSRLDADNEKEERIPSENQQTPQDHEPPASTNTVAREDEIFPSTEEEAEALDTDGSVLLKRSDHLSASNTANRPFGTDDEPRSFQVKTTPNRAEPQCGIRTLKRVLNEMEDPKSHGLGSDLDACNDPKTPSSREYHGPPCQSVPDKSKRGVCQKSTAPEPREVIELSDDDSD